VADGDGATHGVDPIILLIDTEVVEEGEHLHREGLIDLKETDIVDGQTRALESFNR
jgi:hypothetical protein